MSNKCLVAYFSATGATKKIAEKISEITSGDLYEIAPQIPYSSADLDWNDKKSRCVMEWKDQKNRPGIKTPVSDMGQYDVAFVGYPIWWEESPRIVYAFLESYDFSNKTIIPFSTSGGSVRGSKGNHLQGYCAKETKCKPGKLLNSSAKKEALSDSIEDLSL